MRKYFSFFILICLFTYAFPYVKNKKEEKIFFKYSIKKIGIDEPKTKEDEKYLFYNIISADCDRYGNIYILDYKASSVKIFNKEGDFIRKLFKRGKGPEELTNPYRIKINGFNNHMFILQDYGYSIKEFDTNGKFVKIYYLPEQVYNYFEFLSEKKIIFVSSETVKKTKYNFKILNLKTLKIERQFAKINYDFSLNMFQRFIIKDNILLSVPPDRMKLTAFNIKNGSKVEDYVIKGDFLKNKIVRKKGSPLVMDFIYNSAVPFIMKNYLYLLVTIRKYRGETFQDIKEPVAIKNYIYAKKGNIFEKILYLKNCDFGRIETIVGNRLYFSFNEPYPYLKVITIIK